MSADEDVPRCVVDQPDVTCYCTQRAGCPFDVGDDLVCDECGDPACWGDEPDDDAGHGDDWRPIETVDTGGLL